MIQFKVIDSFCGAGGVTTGIEQAQVNGVKVATVILAINHDDIAISSHKKNHPHVKHEIEDIRTYNVKKIPKIISNDFIKKFFWASTECTNLSNAKGGLSRDPDSRTLAEHLPPYIKEFDPDYIGIENVKEFLQWGALIQKRDSRGKLMYDKNKKPYLIPDKNKLGTDFDKWIKTICSLGYHYEYKILNSADYGAHTSRKRLFIIFAKHGLPIAWPTPTHDRYERNGLPKWKPVKECLDFSDKGENIFGRKKDLCEKTYKRIYSGLVKFIAKGDESFLSQYNGGFEDNRVLSTFGHCNTITTNNRFGLVQAQFLMKYHGNGENIISKEDCASTLTTKDRLALITPEYFIDLQHSQGQQNQSIEKPCGTLLTVPKQQLISVESFIDQQFGMSEPNSIESPCNAITTKDKYSLVSSFLFNPQYNFSGNSIEKPCFTLIASMDKRPPYLIQLESGDLAIEINKNDSCFMKKIKMFMAYHGIISIHMRMLRIHELKKITGFPDDYYLEGTQADQKKFIGNAVTPCIPKAIFEALYIANKDLDSERIAI